MKPLPDSRNHEKSLEHMLASFEDLRFGVLATSDAGMPYTSLIAFALTPDRTSVIFATRRATRKYRNMMRQHGVSILLDNRSQTPADLSRAEAVTLVGRAKPLRSGRRKEVCSKIFLDKHPQLAAFVEEPGTALVTVLIQQAIHVSQVQKVARWIRET